MFCPSCRDEFRPGFDRCARCNVDLVAALDEAPPRSPAGDDHERRLAAAVPKADYCGFVDLDEARSARELLRAESIGSEIVIREAPGTAAGGAIEEEYWLRVEVSAFRRATTLLGYEEHEAEPAASEEKAACGACGAKVAAEETFCPHCGARFED